jgi:hypothetical protein
MLVRNCRKIGAEALYIEIVIIHSEVGWLIWKRAELICQFSVSASQGSYRKDLVYSSLGTSIELPRQGDWNGQANLADASAGRPSLIILGLVMAVAIAWYYLVLKKRGWQPKISDIA